MRNAKEAARLLRGTFVPLGDSFETKLVVGFPTLVPELPAFSGAIPI
jgi:hypothetical protein